MAEKNTQWKLEKSKNPKGVENFIGIWEMAKSRKERKAATAQFMLDQWCLLKEYFEHTETPKEAWKMYCQFD